jgi:hypothetical protein
VTSNKKTLASYEICPFAVNYESVMFIVQAPGIILDIILHHTSGQFYKHYLEYVRVYIDVCILYVGVHVVWVCVRCVCVCDVHVQVRTSINIYTFLSLTLLKNKLGCCLLW